MVKNPHATTAELGKLACRCGSRGHFWGEDRNARTGMIVAIVKIYDGVITALAALAGVIVVAMVVVIVADVAARNLGFAPPAGRPDSGCVCL